MAVAVLFAGGKSGTIRIILATYLINSSQVAFSSAEIPVCIGGIRGVQEGRKEYSGGFMFCSKNFLSLFCFSCRISLLDFSRNFCMRGLLETWCQKGVYGTVVICRSEIP